MKCYSIIKSHDVLIHTTWMSLETTVLSEIIQTQKVTSGVIPFIQNMQNRQIIETVDLVAAGDCDGGEWGVTA